MDIPEFIPGLKLSELFYTEQVAPIMRDRFAVVQHSAALIGPGSEVLGFDDETSTDHHWGPRLQLFLSVENLANYGQQIDVTLRQELPDRCLGYPTSFTSPDPDDNGTQLLDWDHQGEINHMVEITTIERFFTRHLGVEVGKELSVSDWLSFPQQILLSLTAGAVFHDEVGLQDARAKLAYYPHDVWLYLMASVWHRIGNEEHLAGRTGQSDQTLGNSLLLHRLVRDAMYLAFMLEKKYAPYPKWFERAFRDLQCSSKLTPHLLTVIGDGSWSDRQISLCKAFEILARMHNDLGLSEPIPAETSDFHGRSIPVIQGETAAKRIVTAITDPEVREVADCTLAGGIDQISDSTEVLEDPRLRRRFLS